MTRTFPRILFRCAAVGVFLTAACAAGVASAQTAVAPATVRAPVAEKPLWNELSKPQQLALEPLRGEWDSMDGARKQKWLEIGNRFAAMKADEQGRVHERMREWLKLTPDERRVARENYTLSKKMEKGQKSAQWEQYQALPEEEKRKLAAEAAMKKQVTNLPPKTQPKAVAPIKPAPGAACATGSVRNTNPAGPACLPVQGGVAAPLPAPAAPPAVLPPTTTLPPVNPALPAPNAK